MRYMEGMMSCCDGWDYGTPVGECPNCGAPVDSDGTAVSGCHWSPVLCETCGDAPCDLSC